MYIFLGMCVESEFLVIPVGWNLDHYEQSSIEDNDGGDSERRWFSTNWGQHKLFSTIQMRRRSPPLPPPHHCDHHRLLHSYDDYCSRRKCGFKDEIV